MSKRKQPAVFVPPPLWTWWKIVGYYDHCLLPFRPTALEFRMIRRGLPFSLPIPDNEVEGMRSFIEQHGNEKVNRARGHKDMEGLAYYAGAEVSDILKYAAIRHLHPVTLPAVMDFSHFL